MGKPKPSKWKPIPSRVGLYNPRVKRFVPILSYTKKEMTYETAGKQLGSIDGNLIKWETAFEK